MNAKLPSWLLLMLSSFIIIAILTYSEKNVYPILLASSSIITILAAINIFKQKGFCLTAVISITAGLIINPFFKIETYISYRHSETFYNKPSYLLWILSGILLLTSIIELLSKSNKVTTQTDSSPCAIHENTPSIESKQNTLTQQTSNSINENEPEEVRQSVEKADDNYYLVGFFAIPFFSIIYALIIGFITYGLVSFCKFDVNINKLAIIIPSVILGWCTFLSYWKRKLKRVATKAKEKLLK